MDGILPLARLENDVTGSGTNANEATITILKGTKVTFFGGNSTDDLHDQMVGVIRSYRWDFDGDGVVDATGATVDWIFDQPGEFTVNLTAVDQAGHESLNATMWVRVAAEDVTPPTVNFSILDENFQEVTSLVEKVTYFFDGSDTTDNLATVQNMIFFWDFGEGNTTTGVNVTFAYDRFGNYNVVLTVTDQVGNAGNANRTVVVGINPLARPDLEIEPNILEIDPESPEETTSFRTVSVTVRLSVTNVPGRARANDVQVSFFAFPFGQPQGDPVPITPVFRDVNRAISDNTLDPGETKTIEFTWITGPAGNYTLRVNVTDPEEPDIFIGPRNSVERHIFVRAAPPPPDVTKPTVAITSPDDRSTLTSTSVMVFGTASDDVALNKVEGSTDGMNWVLATGRTSWFFILNLMEGEHTIFARATDTSGNAATTRITVTVETEPDTPPPGFQVSPEVVTFGVAGAVAVAAGVAALLLWRRRAGGKKKE